MRWNRRCPPVRLKMEVWWLLLLLWVLIQLPFIVYSYRARNLRSRYRSKMKYRVRVTAVLIPWSQEWKDYVRPEDFKSLDKYRRVMCVYYYLIFLLPILSLFAAMMISAWPDVAF